MSDFLRINNRVGDYNNNVNNNDNIYNVSAAAKNNVDENNVSGVKKKETQGVDECETCKNRRYQDGSDDPGVSFKSPTRMSPEQASSRVFSHEREHYTREASKAKKEGKEVVSNDIRVFSSVCPECGKTYISGGETRTVVKDTKKEDDKLEFAKKFYDNTVGKYRAKEIDAKA
ncbi:MAG: hypothetical protein LBS21_11960 [Clostridiales bacterium]|jgi:hypothetical protein|nr:hypothetical protein [Clostridiales bacterium]